MPVVCFGLLPCEQLKDRRPGGKLRTIHPKNLCEGKNSQEDEDNAWANGCHPGRVLEKMETIPEITDVAVQLLETSGSSTRCYKHHTHNNKKYNDKKGLPAESKIQSAEKSLTCSGNVYGNGAIKRWDFSVMSGVHRLACRCYCFPLSRPLYKICVLSLSHISRSDGKTTQSSSCWLALKRRHDHKNALQVEVQESPMS